MMANDVSIRPILALDAAKWKQISKKFRGSYKQFIVIRNILIQFCSVLKWIIFTTMRNKYFILLTRVVHRTHEH